jgi:hypothetical protein
MRKLVLTTVVVALVAMMTPLSAAAQEWIVDIYGGWS